jgi:hypothetical protein
MRAPPNGYAHAGAPKRFVHLVGPPLDVALDARGAGGRGRWVRSGCWPNAEVRAFVCDGSDAQPGKDGKGKGKKKEGRERGDEEDDAPQTHFGIFATRVLKQGEEIVVGWEWDDANAVHRVGDVAGTEGCVLVFRSFFCPWYSLGRPCSTLSCRELEVRVWRFLPIPRFLFPTFPLVILVLILY